jgi:Spy/CpxP family protein refolding chaperone
MNKALCAVVVATIALGTAAAGMAQPAAAASPSSADLDKLIELVRKDVRAEKSDIVSKTMKLDAGQAAAFWPVYKAYETERQALGDQRLAVIQDLAEHFETLNDAKAKGLLDRSFAIEEQRLALEKKYRDELLKVLPAKTVARFFQVESRLNNLINLKVSSQIPLVN